MSGWSNTITINLKCWLSILTTSYLDYTLTNWESRKMFCRSSVLVQLVRLRSYSRSRRSLAYRKMASLRLLSIRTSSSRWLLRGISRQMTYSHKWVVLTRIWPFSLLTKSLLNKFRSCSKSMSLSLLKRKMTTIKCMMNTSWKCSNYDLYNE